MLLRLQAISYLDVCVQPGPSEGVSLTAQPAEERQYLDEKVVSFAETAASREEQVLKSALADLQQQKSTEQQQDQPSVRPLGSERKSATDAASLRLAAMRRIEAARKYSKASAAPSGIDSTPPTPVSAANPSAQQEGPAEWVQSSIGSAEQVSRHLWLYQVMHGGGVSPAKDAELPGMPASKPERPSFCDRPPRS